MNIEKECSFIPNLKEAHDNLHAALDEKTFTQYNNLIKQYYSFKVNKIKFDEEARKLLSSPEQIHLHNIFFLALSDKIRSTWGRPMYVSEQTCIEEGERAMKYLQEERRISDEELIKTRLLVTAFQHDLEGAEEEVVKMINVGLQLYLKNILAATISKCSGYRIRDNSFQHSVGIPVPNPWLRNYSNIIEESQEYPVDLDDEQKTVQPTIRSTLDEAQQHTAFAYLCGKQPKNQSKKNITLKGLYETLLEDPMVISNHTISSINMERILAKLDCS